MTKAPPLLTLTALRTRHVGPVDLTLSAGECVCLSGPSGAGKTLLLRAVADLDPHEGAVSLAGRAGLRFAPAEWRRQVGYLPAESQWWYERVGDHFDRVDAAAWERLGFASGTADWRPMDCSTGERQRLALLRLLAVGPRVLLLDEPTAALDATAVARVEGLLAEYRQAGAALLWVSHDPAQVRRVADRHLLIEAGQVREAAP